MSTLIDALPFAAGGVALVALVALFVSDRSGANEHDLSDYREPVLPEAAYGPVETVASDVMPEDETVAWANWYAQIDDEDDDILPPAPAGMDAGAPLWRALVVEAAVPTLPDDAVRARADEWLRELRDEALAGAR